MKKHFVSAGERRACGAFLGGGEISIRRACWLAGVCHRWLGYLSFSRGGAELLFQVFADRYERGSILITSNLPFGEWGQVFQGERMTAALLDRFTHRCHIFEMNGESFRFKESSKHAKEKKATTK